MIKKKILIVFGTRPEAIKLAPLILKLKINKKFLTKICITSQHKKMLHQVLKLFEIKPDYDLDIMKKDQNLSHITANILNRFNFTLDRFKPDLVIVHGDTSTTMACSLSAFYKKIDIAHVEAGLRTGSMYSPYPEEINRKVTSNLTKFHFAPTYKAKKNLLDEGYKKKNILITGNTVIDSVLWMNKKIKSKKKINEILEKKFPFLKKNKKKIILVTCHRRENFGKSFENICNSILQISKRNKNCLIVYPIHLNPNIKIPVNRILNNIDNILLLDPLNYMEFIFLMKKSHLILTDSGGIQEEAPTLNKPVLIMRDHTERPEAIRAGTSKMVGTKPKRIIYEVEKLLKNNLIYSNMSKIKNPFGDGNASKKIIQYLEKYI